MKFIKYITWIGLIIIEIALHYILPEKLPHYLNFDDTSFIITSLVVGLTLILSIAFELFSFDDKIKSLNGAIDKINPFIKLGKFKDELEQIVKLFFEILNGVFIKRKDKLIKVRLQTTTNSFIKDLKNLKDGNFSTNYWDCTILSECIKKMKGGEELIGITNWSIDKEWWKTGDASTFLEANKIAIGKGHKIKRIFVYQTLEEELKDELIKHHNLNIEVYTFCEQHPSADTINASCVICNSLTYEAVVPTFGNSLNVFSLNQEKIEKTKKNLETYLRNAKKYQGQL